MRKSALILTCACGSLLGLANVGLAQIGYGVNSAGTLFKFDVNDPSNVTSIGPVGFVPEGIDFRPSTSTLYGINVDAGIAQLYTIDINTGAATAVGAGFASSVANSYSLSGRLGFDFNPTTLQGDNSMRIRVVSTTGTNLRLNSSTGQIAAVDSDLHIGTNSPFVDAAAYTNNFANSGGTTQLFVMDARNDKLYLQSPPNAGDLNEIGAFGVTVDANPGIHFDIYTDGSGTNHPYAVLMRPDAPINGPLGAYLLYQVNLATGQITQGALVGPAATPFDFEGGFAMIPEPMTGAFLLLGLPVLARRRRRQA